MNCRGEVPALLMLLQTACPTLAGGALLTHLCTELASLVCFKDSARAAVPPKGPQWLSLQSPMAAPPWPCR